MRALALAAALIAGTGGPALSPVEPSHGKGNEWICSLARDWKSLMRREYPADDRSIPEVERRCHMASE